MNVNFEDITKQTRRELPTLRSESLPFNLRTVKAILQGRLERDEAERRARLLLEDIPRLMGRRLRLRYVQSASSEIWPYYVFTNHKSYPDYFNPAVGYGLNWGDWVTLSKVGIAN